MWFVFLRVFKLTSFGVSYKPVNVIPMMVSLQIDNHEFSNGQAGELTLKIQELYYDIVRGENDKYKSWLTYVH